MEPVARKTAGFRVSVPLSQLGAGNRQKTRCAYQCEIAPWRPSLLVVSRPCSSAASGSQHAARAAALHAPNPPPTTKSAHENAISGPCMRIWRGSSPWPVLEVDLIPAERTQLGDAQPVPVGDQDQGAITVAVSVLPCRGDQALDFL